MLANRSGSCGGQQVRLNGNAQHLDFGSYPFLPPATIMPRHTKDRYHALLKSFAEGNAQAQLLEI